MQEAGDAAALGLHPGPVEWSQVHFSDRVAPSRSLHLVWVSDCTDKGDRWEGSFHHTSSSKVFATREISCRTQACWTDGSGTARLSQGQRLPLRVCACVCTCVCPLPQLYFLRGPGRGPFTLHFQSHWAVREPSLWSPRSRGGGRGPRFWSQQVGGRTSQGLFLLCGAEAGAKGRKGDLSRKLARSQVQFALCSEKDFLCVSERQSHDQRPLFSVFRC